MIRTTLAALAALAGVTALLLAAGTPTGTAFSLAYADLLDSRQAGDRGGLPFDLDLTPTALAALLEEAPLLVRGPDASGALDPAYAANSPFAPLSGLSSYPAPGRGSAVIDPQSQLPEPGSLALLGLGILGLFGLRRRLK